MSQNPFYIFRRPNGKLGLRRIGRNGEQIESTVRIVRCFPWSFPDHFISIRDEKGAELYLFESLEVIADEKIRALIRDEIGERMFLPEITSIQEIVDEIDLFRWLVKTRSGARIFYTQRREIPREVPGGGVVVKDISGDRYFIPNIDELDTRSRNWLWLYLD